MLSPRNDDLDPSSLSIILCSDSKNMSRNVNGDVRLWPVQQQRSDSCIVPGLLSPLSPGSVLLLTHQMSFPGSSRSVMTASEGLVFMAEVHPHSPTRAFSSKHRFWREWRSSTLVFLILLLSERGPQNCRKCSICAEYLVLCAIVPVSSASGLLDEIPRRRHPLPRTASTRHVCVPCHTPRAHRRPTVNVAS